MNIRLVPRRFPTGRIRPRRWVRPLLYCAGALLATLPALRAATPTAGSIDNNPLTVTPTSSITWGGTATGVPPAANGETTPGAAPGGSLDVFQLTVLGTAANFAGTTIPVNITWTNPANDYDLVVRKDDGDGVYEQTEDPIIGTSGNGAPSTREAVSINPSQLNASGTTTFHVVAVYFAVPTAVADQYQGSAEIAQAPSGRTVTYQPGTATFSPNTTVKAPVAARDGEPSSRVDKLGNYYVGGIRGVPAGVDLWYFDLRPTLTGGGANPAYDPLMRNPIYRGQPDAFTAAEGAAADGGGDIDLAVGFNADGTPILAYSSLVAANISTGRSTDLGATFQLNPAGNVTGGPPGDDRQWHEFFGANTCYLLYRTLAPAVAQVQRSDDGGLTYGVTASIGTIGQVGCLDVDQFDGTVTASGSNGVVAIGTPSVPGLAPLATDYQIINAISSGSAAGVSNIFFVAKVADDNRDAAGNIVGPGTIYVCYSDGTDIFLAHSLSRRNGVTPITFSEPVRVNNGPAARTNLLPWMETGPTPGSVAVVWYGTDATANVNNAKWQVFFAQSFNASDTNPTFTQNVASDHFIHGSNISTGGLDATGMGANRNLIDYFQVVFDPTGAAVIGYTDDHNDFDGHTYVTRQTNGPSINAELTGAAATVPTPVEGINLASAIAANPTIKQPGSNGEQVVDFRLDAETGVNTTVNQPGPVDITSIKYTTQDTPGGRILTATMTVSSLAMIPNNAVWRMCFTANAPDAGTTNANTSTLSQYSNGLSDLGDQFYLVVRTAANGTRSAVYGTAVRNQNGSITYTDRGPADRFTLSRGSNTIVASVSLAKLNAVLTPAGRPIITEDGTSILTGLRGRANTADTDDITRGGTSLRVGFALP